MSNKENPFFNLIRKIKIKEEREGKKRLKRREKEHNKKYPKDKIKLINWKKFGISEDFLMKCLKAREKCYGGSHDKRLGEIFSEFQQIRSDFDSGRIGEKEYEERKGKLMRNY